MFSSATTETATMVVRLFVASREVFVASRRNYEITASSKPSRSRGTKALADEVVAHFAHLSERRSQVAYNKFKKVNNYFRQKSSSAALTSLSSTFKANH